MWTDEVDMAGVEAVWCVAQEQTRGDGAGRDLANCRFNTSAIDRFTILVLLKSIDRESQDSIPYGK
jgi:hypothetical protein